MLRIGRRIKRNRKGSYELNLPAEERDLLRSLPTQLLDLLEAGPGEPDLQRLFPPAYTRDEDRSAQDEYQSLMSSDLMSSHRSALRTMAETLDATALDEEQMSAWLAALNELRLVIGTRLDVSEDQTPPAPSDPEAAGYALYGYLTWLQQQAIEALSGSL
jgi:hypothetical protein